MAKTTKQKVNDQLAQEARTAAGSVLDSLNDLRQGTEEVSVFISGARGDTLTLEQLIPGVFEEGLYYGIWIAKSQMPRFLRRLKVALDDGRLGFTIEVKKVK